MVNIIFEISSTDISVTFWFSNYFGHSGYTTMCDYAASGTLALCIIGIKMAYEQMVRIRPMSCAASQHCLICTKL